MIIIDESVLFPTGMDDALHPVIITLSTSISTDVAVQALDANPYA